MNSMATTSTIAIAVAGFLSFAPPIWAQEEGHNAGGDAYFSQLLKCRSIEDIAQKASCYDTAMDNIQLLSKGSKISIVTDVQIENLERDAFGFNLPSLPKLKLPSLAGIEKHALRDNDSTSPVANTGRVVKKDKKGEIVKIRFDLREMQTRPNGRLRFKLKNGQNWLQTDNSKIRVSRRRAKFVEIRKGAIGSYLLRINGEKNAIRVKREN